MKHIYEKPTCTVVSFEPREPLMDSATNGEVTLSLADYPVTNNPNYSSGWYN